MGSFQNIESLIKQLTENYLQNIRTVIYNVGKDVKHKNYLKIKKQLKT